MELESWIFVCFSFDVDVGVTLTLMMPKNFHWNE